MRKQQFDDKIKTLVNDVLDFGDLLIIANKGIGKTNVLMVLSQLLKALPNTRVIIFEDFPKLCLEFDKVSYFIVHDSDVTETKHTIDMEDCFLRHERDYSVKRGLEIKEFLETSKDCIFTMEISDIERSAFFVYSVVRFFYRKAYLRAYKGYKKRERIVFVIEESQNVFDSSTISKKLFNRLRKIFSVARNLDLHFVLASQRLQDLNTKIRGRTRLILGRVSLDNYELKVRRLLRNSKHKTAILDFKRGQFLYTATDSVIQFPKFKADGKPYKWKPKTETQKPSGTVFYTMPKRKASALDKLKAILKGLFLIDRADLDKPYLWKNKLVKQPINNEDQQEQEEDEITEEETDFRLYG